MEEKNKARPLVSAILDAGVNLITLATGASGAKVLLDALGSYERAQEEAAVEEFSGYLSEIVGNHEQLFSDAWLKSEAGRQFWEKIMNAAFDAQAAGKRRQFANAMANGILRKDIDDLDKHRFADVLRQISLPAIVVLSELHQKFGKQVRPISGEGAVKELNLEIDPYTVEAAVIEMQGLGLFSPRSEWKKTPAGFLAPGYNSGFAYNEYTVRFVTFISDPPTA